MHEPKLIDGIRYYPCGDDWLPSVTSVLRATSGGGGFSGPPSPSAQAAMDRGTAIHALCERSLKGRRASKLTEELRPYWNSIRPSLRRLDHCQMTERFVWHRGQRYAGTLDAVARYRKRLTTLVDFKTTSDVRYLSGRLHEYRLQLVAYAAALEDTHGIEVPQALLIVAHPHGPAEEVLLFRDEFGPYWEEWQDRCQRFPAAVAAAQERKAAKVAKMQTNVAAAFQW